MSPALRRLLARLLARLLDRLDPEGARERAKYEEHVGLLVEANAALRRKAEAAEARRAGLELRLAAAEARAAEADDELRVITNAPDIDRAADLSDADALRSDLFGPMRRGD
jgi:hypothetical protein